MVITIGGTYTPFVPLEALEPLGLTGELAWGLGDFVFCDRDNPGTGGGDAFPTELLRDLTSLREEHNK